MKHFYRKYFVDDQGESLEHSANRKHAKYGTKNSTSSEKGKDGKKNNTSEYNHEYYEENTEKWKDNKKKSKKNSTRSNDDDRFYDKDGNARFGHKDYDENDEDFKRTDGEKIEGTNLRTFTNKNGSTIIMGDGIKFSFPPGTKITSSMARQIAKIENGDKSNKESYVAKMLNAVTGFADKQGLNTDTAGKKKSSSKKSSSSKEKSESKEKKGSNRTFAEAKKDYYSNAKKEKEEKKSSSELKSEAEAKGKSQTNRYKKQKKKTTKQNAQFMHSDDIGSILIKDLF